MAVEHVQAQDIVEAGSGLEGVVPTTLLEGNHVRREPVVADLAQVPQSPVLVGYDQAAGPHALDELLMGERRLRVHVAAARSTRGSAW